MCRKLMIVSTFAVLIIAPCSMSQTLLGPPTSEHEEGQLSIGGEYSVGEADCEMDRLPVVEGKCFGLIGFDNTIDDVRTERFYGTIGWGLSSNWDATLRVGVAEADFTDNRGEDFFSFVGDPDSGFSIGASSGLTLGSCGDRITWGIVGQATWTDLEDCDARAYECCEEYEPYPEHTGPHECFIMLAPVEPEYYCETAVLSARDISMFEAQLAIGPNVRLTPVDAGLQASVFGGPCLYYMRGDADIQLSINGVPMIDKSADIEQTLFGGYVGASIGAGRLSGMFEAQLYEKDAWVLAAGLRIFLN